MKPTMAETWTVIGCALAVLIALVAILILTYLGLFPNYH